MDRNEFETADLAFAAAIEALVQARTALQQWYATTPPPATAPTPTPELPPRPDLAHNPGDCKDCAAILADWQDRCDSIRRVNVTLPPAPTEVVAGSIPRLVLTIPWLQSRAEACHDGAREAIAMARYGVDPLYRVDVPVEFFSHGYEQAYVAHRYSRGVEINMETLRWMQQNRDVGWYYLVNGARLRRAFCDWYEKPLEDVASEEYRDLGESLEWLYLQLLATARTNGLALGCVQLGAAHERVGVTPFVPQEGWAIATTNRR